MESVPGILRDRDVFHTCRELGAYGMGAGMKNKTILMEKLRESLSSVLPVSAIILLLAMTITPLPNSIFISFLFGALLMIVGIGFFTLGADKSMTPMGEYVGTTMTKSKKIWLICLLSFFVGAMITISEPDLQVLANYVPSIDTYTFILAVAAGVGVFLVIAILRIIFAVKVKYILLLSYAAIFVLAIFVDPDFWSVAFDAGGVTTGPLSVPFIMAMGVGIAAMTSDREGTDSFGLMALCSIGPVIAILVLGLSYDASAITYVPEELPTFTTSREFGWELFSSFPNQMLEVAKGLLPILAFFFIYQAIVSPYGKENIFKLLIGIVYTYFGIVLFLIGVNIGFLPVGSYIGELIGDTSYRWILIPIGMVIGYFIVSAEPAVQVLEKQVEEATSGTIPKKMLSIAISAGVSLAVGLAMVRALTGISILWFVGIGYAVALALSFFVPDIFTSIAFDSGGVASGTMTSAFLMPLAVGACDAVGGNVMTDAIGVIAMVAVLPTITIQILGLIYQIKIRHTEHENLGAQDSEIIEFETVRQKIRKKVTNIRDKGSRSEKYIPTPDYPDIIEFENEGRW